MVPHDTVSSQVIGSLLQAPCLQLMMFLTIFGLYKLRTELDGVAKTQIRGGSKSEIPLEKTTSSGFQLAAESAIVRVIGTSHPCFVLPSISLSADLDPRIWILARPTPKRLRSVYQIGTHRSHIPSHIESVDPIRLRNDPKTPIRQFHMIPQRSTSRYHMMVE